MNLLELVQGQLSDERLARLAAIVGESGLATRKAVDGLALPAILSGLAGEYSGEAGAARLLELMRAGGHDGTLLNTLDGALAGGAHADALLNLGKGQLGTILGDRVDAVTELMAADTGIRRHSAGSLLGLLVPVVLAVLGRQLQSGGGSARLAEWLAGARSVVTAQAAPGLANALGAALPQSPQAAAVAVQRQGAVWPYLIVPAVALAMFFSLRSCQQNSMRTASPVEAGASQVEAVTPAPAAEAVPATATPAPEDAPMNAPADAPVGPPAGPAAGGASAALAPAAAAPATAAPAAAAPAAAPKP